MRSFWFFLSFCFSLFISPFAAQPLLSSGDIQGVMNQLLELHIDKKEMSTPILGRSLKIYVSHFDPSHSYLLEEEVFTYIHPSDKELQKMLIDYQNDRFPAFFSLNQRIQESILRARGWRQEWQRYPKQLVEEALRTQVEKREKEDVWKSSLSDLKKRHYEGFVRLVAFQVKQLPPGAHEGKEAKIIALCEKQLSHLENDYLGVDDKGRPFSTQQHEHIVIMRTLKSLAGSLDAHTAYYSPEEAYALKVQLEKGMCGIGVVLREGIEGVTIQEVIVGGPADKSGLIQEGDAIVEVNGEGIDGYSFARVLEIMKGKEGSKISLGILRYVGGVPELRKVELTRSHIVLADKRVDVEAEPFGDGYIGKITLYSFYEGEDGLSSEKDLRKAIDELKARGPLHGLVLDMRENTGGFLTQAVKVGGLFISNGVVVISKYSDGSMKYYRAIDGKQAYDGPLVVLISRGSASATEIVAQALKDYGVAVIVGDEQTYGKGTIQHQTVTGGRASSLFKVTVGRYYTVSGRSTQIEGVKADIVVPTEFNCEELGEGFLEYPLPPDAVKSAYEDTLEDIDPIARKWFQKYYLTTMQKRSERWTNCLPTLQANSNQRIAQNRNYQLFLKEIKKQVHPIGEISFGVNDIQMEEAVNIVKDMIYLSPATPAK